MRQVLGEEGRDLSRVAALRRAGKTMCHHDGLLSWYLLLSRMREPACGSRAVATVDTTDSDAVLSASCDSPELQLSSEIPA